MIESVNYDKLNKMFSAIYDVVKKNTRESVPINIVWDIYQRQLSVMEDIRLYGEKDRDGNKWSELLDQSSPKYTWDFVIMYVQFYTILQTVKNQSDKDQIIQKQIGQMRNYDGDISMKDIDDSYNDSPAFIASFKENLAEITSKHMIKNDIKLFKTYFLKIDLSDDDALKLQSYVHKALPNFKVEKINLGVFCALVAKWH